MSRQPKGKSLIEKRAVAIGIRKTSTSIEPAFWAALKEIAALENLTLRELVSRINSDRQHPNLSSAIRLYVLDHYVRLVEERTGGKAKR